MLRIGRSPLLFILLAVGTQCWAADVPGSQDHPLITRYPGSTIQWYEVQGFEPYRIAIGPVTGYRRIDEWVEAQGRITRILYALDGDRSFFEVYSNYLNAAKKNKFEILAEGYHKDRNVAKTVGGRSWQGVHYAANSLPAKGEVPFLQGTSTQGGSGSFAARLRRPEGTVYIAVGAVQFSEDRVLVMLDVIEEQAMEDELIQVDAAAMSEDIDRYGKVALYGIHFDHDKATIKPESKPALEEIAKLLQSRPKLEVYVVGHTDGTGALDYNLRLSKERAREVVETLVEKHGIEARRLAAHGVGPLVPIATNQADPGRTKNRRVELVEK